MKLLTTTKRKSSYAKHIAPAALKADHYGEEIRIIGHLKPLSTLRRPLRSVDIDTKQEESARLSGPTSLQFQRRGVIGERWWNLGACRCDALEKFGGDQYRRDETKL